MLRAWGWQLPGLGNCSYLRAELARELGRHWTSPCQLYRSQELEQGLELELELEQEQELELELELELEQEQELELELVSKRELQQTERMKLEGTKLERRKPKWRKPKRKKQGWKEPNRLRWMERWLTARWVHRRQRKYFGRSWPRLEAHSISSRSTLM